MPSIDDIAVRQLLNAYEHGVFPMAASADSPELYLQDPEWRGVLPLDAIQIPKRLARTIRQAPYEVHVDRDFDAVIAACAEQSTDRDTTWINQEIRQLYRGLFDRGHCHTIEIWHEGRLSGGLYGVTLHGAYFGESMFSRVRDASKIALIYLCARLIAGGFHLLDTQFTTPHLEQFGAVEIPRSQFKRQLQDAFAVEADWSRLPTDTPAGDILAIVAGAKPTEAGG